MRGARIVLALWALALVVAAPFALRQADELTARGFDVGGSESQRAERMLAGVPADFRATSLGAVLVRTGDATERDYARALADLRRAAERADGVDVPRELAEAGLWMVRERPGRPVVVPMRVSVDEFTAPDVARDLRRELRIGDGEGGGEYGGVRLSLVGAGALWGAMLDVTKEDLRHAELIGFPLVLLILLAVFGSVAAALLPLALGASAVVVTGALIHVLSTATLMSFYTTNMASMIGLGVAVDYSLFILVRYREERARGATREEARAVAMRTSGRAVLVSGAAVVVALAGLLLVDSAAVRSLAVGAILVVLVAMLASSTLVPALLAVAGRWLDPKPGRRPGAGVSGRRERRVVERWADAVLRRPALALAAGLAVLLALAAPALDLTTGDGALRQLPEDNETRQGFEAARTVQPAGRGAPLTIVVARADVDRSVAILRADDAVVKTGVRTQTRDGRHILIVATPRGDGDSAEVKALVTRLRERLPASAVVGGNTAAQLDFNAEIDGTLPAIVAWIVALTFVLLLLALRSVPLALGGVATNLLSVGAAFGVLTAVFGWGSPGYVDTIAIPLVLAVVFGLSMDYQVFLLSRIRERWMGGASTVDAVRHGLVTSARTITGAALIMVAVFTAFLLTGVPAVQEVGLGAAVAIAIDATVVRLLIVPAGMALLGERCWWLPGRGAFSRRRATRTPAPS